MMLRRVQQILIAAYGILVLFTMLVGLMSGSNYKFAFLGVAVLTRPWSKLINHILALLWPGDDALMLPLLGYLLGMVITVCLLVLVPHLLVRKGAWSAIAVGRGEKASKVRIIASFLVFVAAGYGGIGIFYGYYGYKVFLMTCGFVAVLLLPVGYCFAATGIVAPQVVGTGIALFGLWLTFTDFVIALLGCFLGACLRNTICQYRAGGGRGKEVKTMPDLETRIGQEDRATNTTAENDIPATPETE